MRPACGSAGTVGGSVPDSGRSLFPPRSLSPVIAIAAGLALLAAAGAPAEEPPRGDNDAIAVSDVVTVTGTRLRDRARAAKDPERSTPAHVTVLGRGEIERRGAQTLQDLLAAEAGVILFDQIGDDVSKTFDLRGFGGTGTRVFLNGAPLNDPRNNSLALELVPLEQLERIEITRGSTAALAGGGSEAGVINLWTRRGGPTEGSISIAAGDFGSRELGGGVASRVGSTDLALTGSLYETDGFRQNADGELARGALDLGWDLGSGRRLDLSIATGAADFGNPGALTTEESRTDPTSSPFNTLDFTDESLTQAALNFTASLTASWSLSANVYARDRGTEALTTGRAAPAFGGFFVDADTSVVGSTVQLGHGSSAAGNFLSFGLEWLDGETDATGFVTPPTDLGLPTPAGLNSRNTTERRTLGLYVQDRWQISPRVTLTAGARYDSDEAGYREVFPSSANDARRDFSELSLRAGLAWSVDDRHSLYASFGEAFLPPTAEELFAFPTFGSNPALEPEDSRSLELGWRARWGDASIDAALFQIDTEDEIVFDPDSPLGLFGANVNIGKARRRGLELAARGELSARVGAFANLTLMEAEFANGPNAGNRLPLVPEERLSVGFDAELPLSLALRATALYVGDQALDNDDANSAGRLDAYTVVNTRLSWSPTPARTLEIFVAANNLFDEVYATRGIFALDFQTFENAVFLTPAPGRRILGGLEWRF